MLDGDIQQRETAISSAQARQNILALEAAMRAEIAAGRITEDTDAMPLDHAFIPGAYQRTLTIPAGMLLVGKIHKGPCFNYVMSGHIVVLTEDGVKEIKAPAFFRSEGGTKRVGYAVTDTVWVNVHGTQETDLERLEDELIAKTFEEVGLLENTP